MFFIFKKYAKGFLFGFHSIYTFREEKKKKKNDLIRENKQEQR
jgi:hypothetical protein